ncbi:MAG: hypothetical protein EAZ92_09525 [Candidatus Kapaibacterium sp.]|nr:MAG: hypothetical protein EAZ92_09525 [Candidatus Kapabacteria bacterium]
MIRLSIALIILHSVAFGAALGQSFAQQRPLNAKTSASTIRLSIIPTFGAKPIVIGDSAFQAKDANNTHIDALKFYISRIQCLLKGVVVLEEAQSFHLIDAAKEASFHLTIQNKRGARFDGKFDAVRFHLGIDSATSVSGAMSGDLDPTRGMYWTWQSGYINVKCEGKSNACTARNNEYQFHLGGYKQPFDCLQTLMFPVSVSDTITIQFDVESFLSKIDMKKYHHFMSPSADAVRLSARAAESFRIVP